MYGRGVQPVVHRPHTAQDGCEYGPTQNHKFTSNIMRFFVIIFCYNIFNVWPKTTLLLPVWHRDAKRLDTPDGNIVTAQISDKGIIPRISTGLLQILNKEASNSLR